MLKLDPNYSALLVSHAVIVWVSVACFTLGSVLTNPAINTVVDMGSLHVLIVVYYACYHFFFLNTNLGPDFTPICTWCIKRYILAS